MPTSYTVVQGDSLPSIGFAYGFHPDTIWNHPANADLKALRGDPNVLLPGDVLTIPDKRLREVPCATARLHRFRRNAVPAILRVQFFWDDRPRADEPYVLEIDGRPGSPKRSDGEGFIQAWIPPDARTARVLFHDGTEVHDLAIGHLDPVDHLSGVQGRLRNLGFFAGAVDGETSDALVAALQAFQAKQGLEPHGMVDDETRTALVGAYGE